MAWLVWSLGVVGVGLYTVAVGLLYVLVFVWAFPIALAVASVGCLAAAWVNAQRGRDPRGGRLRCGECGAGVPPGSGVCPYCRSAVPAVPSRARQSGRQEARATASPGGEPAPPRGWVLFMPATRYWKAQTNEMRAVTGGQPGEESDPAALRWWSAGLFLMATVFAMLAVASTFESWLPALPVLLVGAGVSAAISRWGPGSH